MPHLLYPFIRWWTLWHGSTFWLLWIMLIWTLVYKYTVFLHIDKQNTHFVFQWGRGKWAVSVNEYRVWLWDDEKVLEMDGGDGSTTKPFWDGSTFWLLWIMQIWTLVYRNPFFFILSCRRPSWNFWLFLLSVTYQLSDSEYPWGSELLQWQPWESFLSPSILSVPLQSVYRWRGPVLTCLRSHSSLVAKLD